VIYHRCRCHRWSLFSSVIDTRGKFIAGDNATAAHWKRLIAGVVDIADKHSFAIISKKVNDPNGILRGPRGHWIMKNNWSQISCQTPFKCYLMHTFFSSYVLWLQHYVKLSLVKVMLNALLGYVMLHFVAIPFFLDRRIRTWAKILFYGSWQLCPSYFWK